MFMFFFKEIALFPCIIHLNVKGTVCTFVVRAGTATEVATLPGQQNISELHRE